jgi:hypothetical protein
MLLVIDLPRSDLLPLDDGLILSSHTQQILAVPGECHLGHVLTVAP